MLTATLLAIDTTSDLCSAALSKGGQIYSRKVAAPREHAQRLLSLIDGLLLEAELTLKDLNAIAFGCGPGSFTGIRIATGVAQGLAFGAEVPLVPVSTLRAIAWQIAQQSHAEEVMAVIDARQHEVYWGVYRRDPQVLMKLVDQERVSPHQDVSLPQGWQDIKPEAEAIVQLAMADYALGLAVSPELAHPAYVRNEVVRAN